MLAVLGNDVHHVELEILFLQQQVLMLGVDVHELLADGLHDRKGHRRIVDEGTAFAGGGQFTAEDAVFGIIVDVIVGEKAFQLVAAQVEMGFDDTTVASRLDAFGIGPLS